MRDWLNEMPIDLLLKESNGYMGGWKLVHLVPCRHYSSGRNLCGWVKEEAELAASVGSDAESQTLFLLDGLDEFTAEWPPEIVTRILSIFFQDSFG